MTRFCLVRHGSTPFLGHALSGRVDHALDEQGRAQAGSVARILAAHPIAAVLSSPVARARETAAPIAAGLGLAVIEEAGFSEVDFGEWTGARFDELAENAAWRQWNDCRSLAQAPGGETMLTVQLRGVTALLDAARRWPDKHVVVVSHADIIRAVLAHCLGMPLDLLLRIDIDPGSMTNIDLSGSGAQVRQVNIR